MTETELTADEQALLAANEEVAAALAAVADACDTTGSPPRAALDGLGTCMGQFGSNGLRRDTPLPRQFEQAKIAHTLDGTTDIRNVVISRTLLVPGLA